MDLFNFVLYWLWIGSFLCYTSPTPTDRVYPAFRNTQRPYNHNVVCKLCSKLSQAFSSGLWSGRNIENPPSWKGERSSLCPEPHFNTTQQQSALLIVIKLSDLSTFQHRASVLSARPAVRPFVSARGPLPRVLWGKDKGALGGQREAWWAAETEGEGNEENKALRGMSGNYTTTEGT